MARYKPVDRNPRLLPVVLSEQIQPGSFEFALDHLVDHELDLSALDARFRNDGWSTSVFMDCIGSNGGRFADLYGSTVTISRPYESFHPDDKHLRLTELAKQSLAVGRRTIDDSSFRDLLQDKFEYPMLGILAGHLLLLDTNPALELLEKIVKNTGRLIPGHPDVFALEVALCALAKSPLRQAQLKGPPMLRASWDILVRAAESSPGILRREANWLDFMGGVSGGQVWLTWQKPVKPDAQTLERRSDQFLSLMMGADALVNIIQRGGKGSAFFHETPCGPLAYRGIQSI